MTRVNKYLYNVGVGSRSALLRRGIEMNGRARDLHILPSTVAPFWTRGAAESVGRLLLRMVPAAIFKLAIKSILPTGDRVKGKHDDLEG